LTLELALTPRACRLVLGLFASARGKGLESDSVRSIYRKYGAHYPEESKERLVFLAILVLFH
jgi:hypothetical protein